MDIINSTVVPEKDLPLRDDIRLLGRILGDTVREQQGEEIFSIVEHVRQTSIRFRRSEDVTARRELEGTLNRLSHGQAIHIILVRALTACWLFLPFSTGNRIRRRPRNRPKWVNPSANPSAGVLV